MTQHDTSTQASPTATRQINLFIQTLLDLYQAPGDTKKTLQMMQDYLGLADLLLRTRADSALQLLLYLQNDFGDISLSAAISLLQSGGAEQAVCAVWLHELSEQKSGEGGER